MRDGVVDPAVRALDQRPALAHRRSGQPLVHGELEAEQRLVEAVHRDAAQQAALAVEEVTVGSVGIEQVGELVGEPLEDDRQVELAAERVGGAKQRGLLRQPFLVLGERFLERDAGPQPLERNGRLGGERLHQRQVVGREDAPFVGGRDGDDRDDALLEEERDEGCAPRARRLDEPRIDDVRLRRVVDRERRGLEDGARDARRLVREVEPHLPPPVDVLPARAGEVADGLVPVLGHERQACERDPEHRGDLVEEGPRDALDVRGPRELARNATDALELSAAAGCPAVRANPSGPHWAVGFYVATRRSRRIALRPFRFTKMGRMAHCPHGKRYVACKHWAMRTAARP